MYNGKPSPIMMITPAGAKKLKEMLADRPKLSTYEILERDAEDLKARKNRFVRSPFNDPVRMGKVKPQEEKE